MMTREGKAPRGAFPRVHSLLYNAVLRITLTLSAVLVRINRTKAIQ